SEAEPRDEFRRARPRRALSSYELVTPRKRNGPKLGALQIQGRAVRPKPPSWSCVMNIMTKPKLFTLPPLPYDKNALEPVISARTMEFHYGKHHKAYVDKLNELVKGTEYAQMTLEDVVKATFGDPSKHEIFNNAAQAWNHTFFWACLTPGGGKPKGDLARAIDRDLGGFDKFKEKFAHE